MSIRDDPIAADELSWVFSEVCNFDAIRKYKMIFIWRGLFRNEAGCDVDLDAVCDFSIHE